MKITKQGKLREKIWIGKCHTCGSEAEAQECELRIQRSQRDGAFAWHQCPVCKAGDDNYGGMLFHEG